MFSPESVTNMILTVDRFMNKRGEDLAARRELAARIDEITGTKGMLDAIYVNNIDNYMIPDVAVIHLYNTQFGDFLLDPDCPETCPFGYTVEIHERCFDKLTAEELTALIIHDILQNVQSDTAKIRFIKAYNAVTHRHSASVMLHLFDDISLSEVLFMAFTEICMRPFKVPVMNYDYVATDDVLRNMGLGDAYDSYLEKTLETSNITPEEAMDREMQYDFRDVNTIIDACLDHDIRHYYGMIRDSVPIVTLEHILGSKQAVTSLGFDSHKKEFKRKVGPQPDKAIQALGESYNNPKNEVEIRFQIDKIISSMRYAETESEREVLLFKVKQLYLKIAKTKEKYMKKPGASSSDEKMAFLDDCLDELEALRKKIVQMEIKKRRWSVYIKDELPAGYDY